MDKRWLGVGAVVIGLAIVAFALFARKTDEERIREQLERLSQVVKVEGGENPVFRSQRLAKEFETLFDKNVRVEISELGATAGGKKELLGVAVRAATIYRSAEVNVSPERIQLLASGQAASVDASATVIGDRGNGPEKDERKVHFGLTRSDGDWLIDRLLVTPRSEAE